MPSRRTASASTVAVALLAILCSACRPAGYGEPVHGLPCEANIGNEPIQARVRLFLITGGRRVSPTPGVGSTGSCNYPVRTENDDGVVVVRGNDPVEATLDSFLTIWEYAIPAGSGGPSEFREAATRGEIRVNGARVEGGPGAVPLRDGDTIELIPP